MFWLNTWYMNWNKKKSKFFIKNEGNVHLLFVFQGIL